jgi:hypothetical protein
LSKHEVIPFLHLLMMRFSTKSEFLALLVAGRMAAIMCGCVDGNV